MEHLEDVTFKVGSGTLQIHIVDAETQSGIPNAGFIIRNDLEVTVRTKKLMSEDGKSGMTVDDQGMVEYTGLPKGKYIVWGQAPGYLTNKSEWVTLSDGQVSSVAISLERAAIVSFEMSQELKKRITANVIYLRCRITNVDTNELVPMRNGYIEDEEHTVHFAPEDIAKRQGGGINLPEGIYEIEYRLYQDRAGVLSYKIRPPLVEGVVNVELQKGEVTAIIISE